MKNKNYDFYLSILISESGAPFFGQPPVGIYNNFVYNPVDFGAHDLTLDFQEESN